MEAAAQEAQGRRGKGAINRALKQKGASIEQGSRASGIAAVQAQCGREYELSKDRHTAT